MDTQHGPAGVVNRCVCMCVCVCVSFFLGRDGSSVSRIIAVTVDGPSFYTRPFSCANSLVKNREARKKKKKRSILKRVVRKDGGERKRWSVMPTTKTRK